MPEYPSKGILSSIGPRLRLIVLLIGLTLLYAFITRIALFGMLDVDAGLTVAGVARVIVIGFAYDLAFAVYLCAPAVLWCVVPARAWQTSVVRTAVCGYFFVHIYLLGFIAESEFVFFDEFGTRFNFIAVDYLIYTSTVLLSIWESYRVVYLLLINLAVTAIVFYFAVPVVNRLLDARDESAIEYRAATSLSVVIIGFVLFLGQEPRLAFSNDFARELASNGPYQFVAAFRDNELDYDRFYARLDLGDVDRLLREELTERGVRFASNAPMDIRRYVDNPGNTKRLNVVLIMVESLSADFMERYGDVRNLTPFLNDLSRESLVFDRFYATGTRTVRGLEAVTLSIPPTPGRSIVKRRGRESGLWSLGNVLNSIGYDSVFAYGGRGYFDNMSAFFAGNGYRVIDQSTVDAADIGFANAWGMSDEDLYTQALSEIDRSYERDQPIFLHIMTTSNHRPYTFPEGRVSSPTGGRAAAVRYTDWALRDFIGRARSHPWFAETIFVVLGDHCANSAGKVDLPAERYHIPLIIFSPGHVRPSSVATIASQIDVAPTLLGLLNVDYDSAFFGRDVLSTNHVDGRALIGNYEYLGLLQNDDVTILGPNRLLSRHSMSAETSAAPANALTADDITVQRAIAYYQGASYIYQHKLNRWRTDHAPIVDTRVSVARP